jgi:hypothetical protein
MARGKRHSGFNKYERRIHAGTRLVHKEMDKRLPLPLPSQEEYELLLESIHEWAHKNRKLQKLAKSVRSYV